MIGPQHSQPFPTEAGIHTVDATIHTQALFELDCTIIEDNEEVIAFDSPQELLGFLTVEHHSTSYVLNNQAGKPLGYFALIDHGPTVMEVLTIGVTPDAQGEGHGTTMMRHAEQIAQSTGRSIMRLVAKASNEKAVTFYERRGYINKGLLENHYSNYDDEPRISFEKELHS